MSAESFYAELASLEDFLDITDLENKQGSRKEISLWFTYFQPIHYDLPGI